MNPVMPLIIEKHNADAAVRWQVFFGCRNKLLHSRAQKESIKEDK